MWPTVFLVSLLLATPATGQISPSKISIPGPSGQSGPRVASDPAAAKPQNVRLASSDFNRLYGSPLALTGAVASANTPPTLPTPPPLPPTLMTTAIPLAAGQTTDDVTKSWQQFKQDYGRSYTTLEEEQKRFEYFTNNLYRITTDNIETAATGALTVAKPFKLGVNDLLDRSDPEFSVLCGSKPPPGDAAQVPGAQRRRKRWATSDRVCGLYSEQPKDLPSGPLPASFDWREKDGVVLDVLHQGYTCGSCWAFGVMGVYNIMTHLLRLKQNAKVPVPDTLQWGEQMLVDCVPNGCGGGWPPWAFDFIQRNGVMRNAVLPYTGSQAPQCTFAKVNASNDICKAFVSVFNTGEDSLKRIVATVGPVVVDIHSDSFGFRNYKSGVYADDPDCAKTVDHSVIVVGYGSDTVSGLDYWIVRNSWGPYWGDKGYIKMARNRNNYCNISTYQFYIMNLEADTLRYSNS